MILNAPPERGSKEMAYHGCVTWPFITVTHRGTTGNCALFTVVKCTFKGDQAYEWLVDTRPNGKPTIKKPINL